MYVKKGDCHTVRSLPEHGLPMFNPWFPHQTFLVTKSAHDQITVDIFISIQERITEAFSQNWNFTSKEKTSPIGKNKRKHAKDFSKVSQLQLYTRFDLRLSSWGFERSPSWQNHDVKTESQNVWGWCDLWKCPTPPAQAGTAPHQGGSSWVSLSPWIETLQPLQANPFKTGQSCQCPQLHELGRIIEIKRLLEHEDD